MNVYLDNNATTMVAPEVAEAMVPFFTERYGNPSSIHSFGGRIRKEVEAARVQVANLLGASADDILFTSGGSEGDNLAVLGAVQALGFRKRHIVTTRVEHPAVRGAFHYLQKEGYRLTEIGVDREGQLDMDALEEALTPDTALLSVMWANNETGVVYPIEDIAAMARKRSIVFHTDAVQAAGKIPIDLRMLPIDLLTISGHKLHAPKGVGALYIRKGTKVVPQIKGGHQEGGRRAGTENVPGVVGLGVACDLAARNIEEENDRVRVLRDRLQAGILEKCPGAVINGKNRLPNTLNVSFEYIEGESILLMMDDLGISASSGSACTSGSLEPSHVLRAMGVPFTLANGSIRFSLSRYNTGEEIDYVLEKLPPVVERLKEISPFVNSDAKDFFWESAPG